MNRRAFLTAIVAVPWALRARPATGLNYHPTPAQRAFIARWRRDANARPYTSADLDRALRDAHYRAGIQWQLEQPSPLRTIGSMKSPGAVPPRG